MDPAPPPSPIPAPAIGDMVETPPPDQLAADRALLAVPSRQAPIAVIFIAWRFIKNLGMVNIGIAVVFLFSGRLSGALLGIGVIASLVGLVFMLLAWWRFVFSVDGDELRVTKGVISEERLTIPLDRVQSVSINQKFLNRIIGLVSASVDTAGSSAAEFEIDAVDRAKAEALQRLVAGHRRSAGSIDPSDDDVSERQHRAGEVVAEVDVVRRTWPELVKIGVSRWPWAGLVALAPLIAVFDDLQSALPIDLPDEDLFEDRLPSEFGAGLLLTAIVGVMILILIISLLGAVLQVAREVVSNWDMRLTRTSTGLRRTAGLLSTTSKASTLSRIQAVQTDRTPIQSIFGIRRLTLPTVGEGDIDVPGATDTELSAVRDIVFGQDVPPPLDRVISPLAVFLATRNRALMVVPLMALLARPLGWWVLLGLLLVPLEWLVARRRWRLRRWSMFEGRLAESYALVNTHTAEFDLIKTQTAKVTRSFFERRRGLATIRIETAEGHLAVPLIPLAEAEAVRDRALHTVESDRRSFM